MHHSNAHQCAPHKCFNRRMLGSCSAHLYGKRSPLAQQGMERTFDANVWNCTSTGIRCDACVRISAMAYCNLWIRINHGLMCGAKKKKLKPALRKHHTLCSAMTNEAFLRPFTHRRLRFRFNFPYSCRARHSVPFLLLLYFLEIFSEVVHALSGNYRQTPTAENSQQPIGKGNLFIWFAVNCGLRAIKLTAQTVGTAPN